MDALGTMWNWSTEQWLERADRFEKMAEQFNHRPELNASFRALSRDALVRAKDGQLTQGRMVRGTAWTRPADIYPPARMSKSDLSYFRHRANEEETAGFASHDQRVRSVHLQMAERYRALVRNARCCGADMRPAS